MSIITVCRQAWNTSKRDHQPVFDDLVLSYQNMLQQRASGAITSGVVNDDGPLASFDRAAIEASYAIEPPPEVKAELVEEVIAEQEPEPEPPTPKPKKPVVKTIAKKLAEKKSTKKGAKKR